jgi:hypothetical protein
MKIKIPKACSQVQTFLKSTKEMNNVVAFLAVEVIDIVRAPYSRVINAEQDDPKKPAVQNSINTDIFLQKVQMECPPTPSSISSYVPRIIRTLTPSVRSPLHAAAKVIAAAATEDSRNK